MKRPKVYGVGRCINEVRRSFGYSSNRLSESCNISAEYLRQIEAETKTPSLYVFICICRELGISADYLLRDSLNPKPTPFTTKEEILWKYTKPREQGIITAMLDGATDYVTKNKS